MPVRTTGLRTYSGLLGSFAVAHGASEWLDLIALLAGDTPAFAVARTALMAASYLLLLEFARRHAIHFGLHIPGPALHLALILLVGFSGIENGLVTANVVARYAIGFTADMATACLFARHSAGVSGSAGRLLRLVAVGFGRYQHSVLIRRRWRASSAQSRRFRRRRIAIRERSSGFPR
jgi:hypothetical protein